MNKHKFSNRWFLLGTDFLVLGLISWGLESWTNFEVGLNTLFVWAVSSFVVSFAGFLFEREDD